MLASTYVTVHIIVIAVSMTQMNILHRRDNSVSKTTGYSLDDVGSIPAKRNVFLSFTKSRLVLGYAQPPFQ
jgi:hypothetical protein